MYKITILLLLFAIAANAERVNIQCLTSSVCASGHIYRYTSGANTVQNCSIQTRCPFQSVDIEVFRCQHDFKGDMCSTQTCFLTYQIELCVGDQTPSCPDSVRAQVQCQACVNDVGNCTKCLSTEEQQVCYNTENCEFTSVQTDYTFCQNGRDFAGNTCACCARFLFGSEQVGECSQGYSFDNAQFNAFASEFVNQGISVQEQYEKLPLNIVGIAIMLIALIQMI